MLLWDNQRTRFRAFSFRSMPLAAANKIKALPGINDAVCFTPSAVDLWATIHRDMSVFASTILRRCQSQNNQYSCSQKELHSDIWLKYSELINRWWRRILWVFFWLLCCQRTKNVKRRFRDYFLLLILWLWLPPWVFRITGNQSIVTWKNVNVEMTYPYNRIDGSLSHRSWKVDSKMGTDDVEINRILYEPSVVVE